MEKDCDMVEINPLITTKDGKVMAADSKVTIDDIPLKREYTQSNAIVGNRTIYEVGTNGLIYSDFLFPCSNLSDEELLFSSLYTFIITEVGFQEKSYEEIQAHQSKISG